MPAPLPFHFRPVVPTFLFNFHSPFRRDLLPYLLSFVAKSLSVALPLVSFSLFPSRIYRVSFELFRDIVAVVCADD